ncbi:MAG: hypothetical protein IJ506_05220 [Clostridia bacterium]|nr:hypothetical protein [Clostridia bacterium]
MYNIKDYGAIADSKIVNTEFIQKAIDECYKNGGGSVVIPSGEFVTGTIWLKDNVELHLEHGAVLKASTDMADYNADDAYPQNFGSVSEQWTAKHLIVAHEVKNVAITGTGVINGSGDRFFGEAKKDLPWMTGYVWRQGFARPKDLNVMRPGQMICFIECENVRVENVTMINCPCWTCFLYGCEYVQVRGVKVFNEQWASNTDGLDIDCCRYVTVSDCIIATGDDCIAIRCSSKRLKKYRPCEYITVTNCVFASQACGIRFGVGQGEIRHVRVSNITVEHSGWAFLVQTRYGPNCEGYLDDINVSNVSGEDVCSPFGVVAPVGAVTRVTFDNLRFNCIANARITASGDGKIADITVRNTDLYLKAEPNGVEFTEKRLDARGREVVRVENTENVTLDGVRVFAADGALSKWDGSFCERNNRNLTVKNCVFP